MSDATNYVNTAHTQEPLTGPIPPTEQPTPESTRLGSLSTQDAIDLDDERRSVPLGWTRAFDKSSGHHFYVDKNTNRSSWLHPYDDPEFIRSLPDTDPANPNSSAARDAMMRAVHEQGVIDKITSQNSGNEDDEKKKKGWLKKAVEKVTDDGSGLEDKAIKEAEKNFIKRKESLKAGKATGPGTMAHYAPDPFKYTPPLEPFTRSRPNEITYSYGYPGGYGRVYSPVFGYGRMHYDSNSSGYLNGLIQGGGSPLMGQKNHGFHG